MVIWIALWESEILVVASVSSRACGPHQGFPDARGRLWIAASYENPSVAMLRAGCWMVAYTVRRTRMQRSWHKDAKARPIDPIHPPPESRSRNVRRIYLDGAGAAEPSGLDYPGDWDRPWWYARADADPARLRPDVAWQGLRRPGAIRRHAIRDLRQRADSGPR